jgi:transposase InsO family protein
MSTFLIDHNIKIGRDALFDLLDERGMLIRRRKRKGPVTTLSKHRFKKYPNIIREFIPIAPNQLWVSDITYIRLSHGFAYLSLITDAYSHKIVGFYLNKDLSRTGPLAALKMALNSNPLHDGLIHHSDRGSQYCCDEYVKLMTNNEIRISMTEKGDPLENAIAERVNGILKHELLEETFLNFEKAQIAVAVACSSYNYLRPHNSINNLKPVQAHQLSGTLKKQWKSYYHKNLGKEEQMV